MIYYRHNRKRGTNPCTTKVQGFTPKVSNYIVSVWNRIAEEKTQALSRFTYRLQIPEVDRKKIEKIISAISEEPSMTNEEMKKVKGGSINWGMLAGIGAFTSFVIGLVDGWINPKKCNNY